MFNKFLKHGSRSVVPKHRFSVRLNRMPYSRDHDAKPWLKGPGLKDFIKRAEQTSQEAAESQEQEAVLENHYYLGQQGTELEKRESEQEKQKVYIETYGCQMNESDSEIVLRVMATAGYQRTLTPEDAHVILINTCAVRDNAEQKIWQRLRVFQRIKKQRGRQHHTVVGVLGCMAERLKTKLLEGSPRLADLVMGPDAYRDLPHLVQKVSEDHSTAVNVMLSLDETYADIAPLRIDSNGVSAYVTIMRGCNNMCSYCIVPFTRGRERSRPIGSILEEVKQLSEQGYKEITLLGQNVNSYFYEPSADDENVDGETQTTVLGEHTYDSPQLAKGFKTIYKPKDGAGIRFSQLLESVAKVDPEMRIRFTSPHPKDFADDLLYLIRKTPNICKFIHVPAQSGSSAVLERMRRGYTREAYIELVDKIRTILPEAAISTDFISGFCEETEEEHLETISLLEHVRYDQAFMFAYSLREKTHAHRVYKDDVPEDVKQRRLAQVIQVFRTHMLERNMQEIGKHHLVLIDGTSRRSADDFVGRTDTNKKVILPQGAQNSNLKPGDYVKVKIANVQGQTLFGELLQKTTQQSYYNEL